MIAFTRTVNVCVSLRVAWPNNKQKWFHLMKTWNVIISKHPNERLLLSFKNSTRIFNKEMGLVARYNWKMWTSLPLVSKASVSIPLETARVCEAQATRSAASLAWSPIDQTRPERTPEKKKKPNRPPPPLPPSLLSPPPQNDHLRPRPYPSALMWLATHFFMVCPSFIQSCLFVLAMLCTFYVSTIISLVSLYWQCTFFMMCPSFIQSCLFVLAMLCTFYVSTIISLVCLYWLCTCLWCVHPSFSLVCLYRLCTFFMMCPSFIQSCLFVPAMHFLCVHHYQSCLFVLAMHFCLCVHPSSFSLVCFLSVPNLRQDYTYI